jgi:hypothetical protein
VYTASSVSNSLPANVTCIPEYSADACVTICVSG